MSNKKQKQMANEINYINAIHNQTINLRIFLTQLIRVVLAPNKIR